jgi:succinoglycan biosynthesis protein ExoW
MLPPETTFRVGVVIPFYQRQSGLLISAVRSALYQHGVPSPSIFIVDDQSPVPARTELDGLSDDARTRVTVVEQSNGGPGAARNHALELLTDDIDIVAFLDSDDVWEADHLENAMAAFAAGADVYFADFLPTGSDRSKFELCGLTEANGQLLDAKRALYLYTQGLFDALLRRSPIGTQTVVYRRSIARDLRFRLDFHFAEDVFFWMELTDRARKVVFRLAREAVCGIGVNIAASAVWGSPKLLRRDYHDFAFHQAVAERFRLTAEQRQWNDQYKSTMAASFAACLLHLLRHRKPVEWRVVVAFARRRPSLLRDILAVAGAPLRRRLGLE